MDYSIQHNQNYVEQNRSKIQPHCTNKIFSLQKPMQHNDFKPFIQHSLQCPFKIKTLLKTNIRALSKYFLLYTLSPWTTGAGSFFNPYGVGAGTKLKDQCPRPRAKSDFYTCKISERIFLRPSLWLPWVFARDFARAWGIDSFSENNADFQNNFSWTGGITLFRKTLFRWCHVKKW